MSELTLTKFDGGRPPYDLLLLADPSMDCIDKYLSQSQTYVARKNEVSVGTIVLFPCNTEILEIKNIAVNPEFQKQGIGSYLIKNAIRIAIKENYKHICIGTANSSIGQLGLYQKLGFEITEIRKFYFTQNYREPIFENGIQAKHMLWLSQDLIQYNPPV